MRMRCARALRCAECCAGRGSVRVRGDSTHQPTLVRRLLHLGVQTRLEVLDEEHNAVGPADREEEVLPAVGVGCELAHRSGPLLELHLVRGVVAVVRVRRLRHHPEESHG